MISRPRVLFVNLLLLAASLGISVLLGEAAARWFYRDVTTTGDFRGYFSTRWTRTQVRENHYGFRDPEFDEIKSEGLYRIAVLGDSFAYGNGITEEDRFSNRLAAALRDRNIQVLNFSFPGNNWPDHVATLERRVLRLKPDFVLLQWGTNDIELASEVGQRPSLPPLAGNAALHDWLYARSALYTILNAQWTQFLLRRQMGDSYAEYMKRLYQDPNSDGSRKADEWMQRFLALCREQGVPVALILFPHLGGSLGADYPFRFLHERTCAACAAAHVPCIDLTERFAAVANQKALWASPLDPHPSALANRIAAEEILAVLAPSWGFGQTVTR